MTEERPGLVVVCGATGRQGGAVTRHLLNDGWQVRGVTRDASTPKARALAATGAEVVEADMSDRAAMERAFAGAYGVYSVQNGVLSGFDAEVVQGRIVADAGKAAGIRHLVYGSAGIGTRTGIPSWDAKVEIEGHIAQLGVPATVFRPEAFMELMTDPGYYPAVGVWHVMPRLMGARRNVPWLAVDDLGAIVARAFAAPSTFLGATIPLAADVRSIDECRSIWRETYGRAPRRFPMPVWVFQRVAGHAGRDLPAMWRWLRTGSVPEDTAPTRAIHPGALTVREWLERGHDGRGRPMSRQA